MTAKLKYSHLYKDRRWYKLRSHQLKEQPLCEYCLERDGRYTAATVVDHYVPHRGDERLFADPDNLRSSCKHCHDSYKQRLERRGVEDFGHDEQGKPRDPAHHWNR